MWLADTLWPSYKPTTAANAYDTFQVYHIIPKHISNPILLIVVSILYEYFY